MPVTADLAGELSRYLDMLKQACERERQALSVLRSRRAVAQIEQQLRDALSAADVAALEDVLGDGDVAVIRAEIDVAQARLDALQRAAVFVKGRLDG